VNGLVKYETFRFGPAHFFAQPSILLIDKLPEMTSTGYLACLAARSPSKSKPLIPKSSFVDPGSVGSLSLRKSVMRRSGSARNNSCQAVLRFLNFNNVISLKYLRISGSTNCCNHSSSSIKTIRWLLRGFLVSSFFISLNTLPISNYDFLHLFLSHSNRTEQLRRF